MAGPVGAWSITDHNDGVFALQVVFPVSDTYSDQNGISNVVAIDGGGYGCPSLGFPIAGRAYRRQRSRESMRFSVAPGSPTTPKRIRLA